MACLHTWVIVGALCSPAQGPSADPLGAVTFDWHQFGKQVRDRFPAEVAKRPKLSLLGFAVEQVALQLDTLGIAPNFDAAGRERAARRYGPDHASVGTCGYLSGALREAFLGAGFRKEQLVKISVANVRPNGLPGGGDWLNADHAAILFCGREVRVFDLWMAGRAGKYAESEWNGMTLDDWMARMNKAGYNVGSCEGGFSVGTTGIDQLSLEIVIGVLPTSILEQSDPTRK